MLTPTQVWGRVRDLPNKKRIDDCVDGCMLYYSGRNSSLSNSFFSFKKGELERDEPPCMLTPSQVWCRVRDFPKVIKTSMSPPSVHVYGE